MTARGYTTEEGQRLNNFAIELMMYVDETIQAGLDKLLLTITYHRCSLIGRITVTRNSVYTQR
jgi:hypothetical protein